MRLSRFFDYDKFLLLLATFVFFVCLNSAIRGPSSFKQYWTLQERKETMVSAVERLEIKNKILEETIQKLKKSQSYAKKVLKDKFHTTEEGERLVYFK